MVRLILPFSALLAAVAFMVGANGALFTLLPIRAEIEGFREISIGFLGASYFAGFILGCFLTPWMLRRAGHVRSFAALASLMSVLVLLFPMMLAPLAWWLLRALTGFCLAGLFLTIESWLNGETDNQHRGKVFAVYATINLLIISLSQLLIVTGDPAGERLFAAIAILFSLAILPLMLTTGSTPAQPSRARIAIASLFRCAPVGAVGTVASGFANGAFWSLGPLYATGLGLSITWAAIFMSLVGVGAALSQWPWGRLSDRTDRRRVILLLCLGGGAVGMGLFFAGHSAPLVVALAVAFGATAMPLNSVCVAHVNDHAPPGESVGVSGGLNLLYGLGAIVGPLVASAMMAYWTVGGLFILTAVTHLLLAGFILYRVRQRPASAIDPAREDWLPLPTTNSGVFELDPRFDQSEPQKPPTPSST